MNNGEEYELLDDPKYRSYISQIEKCLKNFENTAEWADLISTLGKLNKVLLSHMKYPVVPRRIIIAKRLAQCLHPALPSGVHLKALEIYDVIFKCMGTNRLSQELFIYSAGLFPLFSSAAMNVRSALLTIYENHFVPLGTRLRPGLNGFLAATLSGVEEGSDHLERTSFLLQRIGEGVGMTEFFGCMWECILNNSNVRLPGLVYITNSFNKKATTEDQLHVIGTNVDVMKLNKQNYKKITLIQKREKYRGYKRLYSWLLGSEVNWSVVIQNHTNLKEKDDYFGSISRRILIEALIRHLRVASRLKDSNHVRIYKIINPLLDKPEIGPFILDDVFLDILRCFYHTCENLKETFKTNEDCPFKSSNTRNSFEENKAVIEVKKNLLLIFSALQASYPFYFCNHLLKETLSEYKDRDRVASQENCVNPVGATDASVVEICRLLQYVLTVLPLDTQQHSQSSKMTEVLSSITNLFTEHMALLSPNELFAGLELCKTFLEKLIPTTRPPSVNDLPNIEASNENGIIQIGIEAGSAKFDGSNIYSNNSFDEDSNIISNNVSVMNEKFLTESDEHNSLQSSSQKLKMFIPTYPLTHSKESSDCFETEINVNKADTISIEDGENFADDLPGNPDISKVSFIFKYMKEFQNLFINFVKKLLIDPDASVNTFEKILMPEILELSNVKKLKLLLQESIKTSSEQSKLSFSDINIYSKETLEVQFQCLTSCVRFGSHAHLYLHCFKSLCAILVELSSMPSVMKLSRSSVSNKVLPKWLIALLVCAVGGSQMSAQFTQTAIATFLELMALAQSDLSAWKLNSSFPNPPETQGTTSLRMLPLLTPAHMNTLLNHTFIFQFMTRELWKHLQSTELQLLSSELLLQLHGLSLFQKSPSPYLPQHLSVVEKEVMKYLTEVSTPSEVCASSASQANIIKGRCDSDAIIRWITLWQVSRSLSKSVIHSHPYLNRCLFLMVERLSSDSVLERSYSQNWLSESLNYGDLNRILDPILLHLLHPYTRRISVQHVNIEQISSSTKGSTFNLDMVDEQINESKIYAISSVGGEVMYHISKKESSNYTSFKKQTLALTSLSSGRENKFDTREVKLSNYEVPVSCHSHGLPMSLMINPFSQHPWIDIEDLAKINRSERENKSSNGYSTNTLCKVINSNESKQSGMEHAKKPSATEIVESILKEIIENAVLKAGANSPESSVHSSGSDSSTQRKDSSLHPLHTHMLLYTQLVDVGQCLYGLHLIKNILNSQPELFLLSLTSTSINSHSTSSPLLVLLARHRRSVFGEGFEGGNVSDMIAQFRSTMYLQVVITVCLYYIRSYYPQQPHLHVQQEHLQENRELQVVAAEVLETLFSQLTPLVAGSPSRGFSSYIFDLLNKCKVQKCVLHCLLSISYLMKEKNCNDVSRISKTLTQDILEYNFCSNSDENSFTQEQPYFFSLMDLTLSLIMLEDVLIQNKSESIPHDVNPNINSNKTYSLSTLRYICGQPIPSQPMFLWSLVLVLSEKNLRRYHSAWITFFTSSLRHTNSALPLNCLRIMTLICSLLEDIATQYKSNETLPSSTPSDYTLHLLSGLTHIVHFSLLESSSSNSTSIIPSSTSSAPSSSLQTNQTPGQILSNLFHVFSPASDVLEASIDTSALDPIVCTRKTLLGHLPRLVSALLSLWICSPSQSVKQQIIELLSPICHHHTPHVLAALGVVWQGVSEGHSFLSGNYCSFKKVTSGSLWKCSSQQRSLVEMLAALKVLPLHTLVENVKQVFRNPPVIEGAVQKNPLEVSILQLFFLYLKETASENQLSICWSPFLSLVKEGLLCLPPPAVLVLLACLNEFVQRSPQAQDKKEMKEQQEVTGKILECVSTIAGSRLEPTTWLRRNLTVRPDLASEDQEAEDNVTKFKKANMSAFHVCSQLLSSLSSYQYTLKAWRKDVLELLLDPNTFRMLPETLPYWRSLIDNLCTHDKTVFKELLGRVSMSPASLNLFGNKESEYEIRAGLLKRLAFAIFCSETDQYLRLIPDIQERLTEVTRLGHVVPGLVAQVFLCFRVLLLRVSSRGTTSLWPIVITELVQVLLMMEQELSTDTDQFSSHLKRLSTLDSRWVLSTQNGLHAHNNPAWLSLYFAACKLLDLMVALPASCLPQFQMYRWAFVGTEKTNPNEDVETKVENMSGYLLQSCEFVPHIVRITRLMNQKSTPPVLQHEAGKLLLTNVTVASIMDLYGFFNTLTKSGPLIYESALLNAPRSSPYSGPYITSLSTETCLKHIEVEVEQDFLEPVFS
ncbi:Protein dopey-1-like protein [Armadillidium nasatum]|uniref:Protein dopey-1-like protein n=2 Tax=Armadillidium nasatum TaxID=96803 RepID=A0A5N5TCF3_9CRUS|nr:Protein dopey-1-like protein [Armadillidium nasatum]